MMAETQTRVASKMKVENEIKKLMTIRSAKVSLEKIGRYEGEVSVVGGSCDS